MTDAWPQYVLAALVAMGRAEPSGAPLRAAGSFSAIPERRQRSLASSEGEAPVTELTPTVVAAAPRASRVLALEGILGTIAADVASTKLRPQRA